MVNLINMQGHIMSLTHNKKANLTLKNGLYSLAVPIHTTPSIPVMTINMITIVIYNSRGISYDRSRVTIS
jgi:hypothetical protein